MTNSSNNIEDKTNNKPLGVTSVIWCITSKIKRDDIKVQLVS